jgi:hypothetical protein
MSELKCCPFCGGEAEVGYTNQHDKLFVVGCNTPMCYGNINHFTMVFVSEETAIDTWNTRTPMANIVEKLEEENDFFGGKPMGTIQKAYYCKGIETAINIVKQEINKEN